MAKKINRSELSKVFNVSLTAIDNWLRTGCPGKKKGKNWYFDPDEVSGWLEERHKKESTIDVVGEFKGAKEELEFWKAKLAKLEYDEKTEKLVNTDEVKAAAFNSSRIARDSLMNIPDRLAPLLVNIADLHQVHKLLSDEIRKVCEELANSITYKQ
ncbi:MAG: terminase small subunit [Candidatus Jettenia caeni]|nr:MAG: terminase small subunit [Candidatus Jettenia caeni]